MKKYCVIILFINFFVYGKGIFNNLIIKGLDITYQFYYYIYFFKNEILKNHSFPIWCKNIFSGWPFAAVLQSTVFYPPLYLVLLMPIPVYLNLIIPLHLTLGSIFLILFLRKSEIDYKYCIFGGLLFSLNGFVYTHFYYGHLTMLYAYSYIPVILYYTQKFLYNRIKILDICLFGFFLSLQFLSGHPQIFFYTIVFALFYFLFNLIVIFKIRYFRYKNIYLFIFVLLLFLILTAPQIYYSSSILMNSSRNISVEKDDYSFNTYWSYDPKHLMQIVMPEIYGTKNTNNYWRDIWRKLSSNEEFSIFIGLISLVFILNAYLIKDKKILFFKIMLIVSLLIALGKNTIFYGWIYNYIPFFKMFRWPIRFMSIFQICACIMTVYGLDDFIAKKRKYLILLMLLVIICSALVLGIIKFFHNDLIAIINSEVNNMVLQHSDQAKYIQGFETLINNTVRVLLKFVLILSAVLVASFLFIKNIIRNKMFVFILFVLFLVDHIGFSKILVKYHDFTCYLNQQVFLDIKKENNNDRVLVISKQHHIDQAMSYDYNTIAGYDPLAIGTYFEFMNKIETVGFLSTNKLVYIPDFNSNMIRLLNLKSVYDFDNYIKKNKNDFRNYLIKDNKKYIYKFTRSIGWLKCYNNFKIIKDREKHLNYLNSAGFDPEKVIVLFDKPDIKITLDNNLKYSYQIKKYSSNKIIVEIDVNQNCMVFLSEIYFPVWKCYVNNHIEKIKKVDYTFRGIEIKKGRNFIKLKTGMNLNY